MARARPSSLVQELVLSQRPRMYHGCLVSKQSSEHLQVLSRRLLRLEIRHCRRDRFVRSLVRMISSIGRLLPCLGDASGQIHFEGYQVSNQCMALVKSQILLPTYDASELGYIKETSPEQYVPDVYYKVPVEMSHSHRFVDVSLQEKDSYNNEVMKIARPLPLEYLIIDVPTGFPTADAQIQSMFNDACATIKTPFCVENRMRVGELQVRVRQANENVIHRRSHSSGHECLGVVSTTIFEEWQRRCHDVHGQRIQSNGHSR